MKFLLRALRIGGLTVSIIVFTGCQKERLRVSKIAQPDYPTAARFESIQGTVKVEISIGADGKVFFVKGSGADSLLVSAAEENARKWEFGPFPPVAVFPVYHTITYVYRLEGKPRVVDAPRTIKTFLPDRIEVTGVPLVSDYPPRDSYKPIPKPKP